MFPVIRSEDILISTIAKNGGSMKSSISLSVVVFAALLSGCASRPQTPIAMSADAVAGNKGRIGVAMTALPKVDTHFPGASCLLCMAAASVANSSLTTHTQTLPHEELPKLKTEIAELLRKKGADVVVIPEPLMVDSLPEFSGTKSPNITGKDFASLRQKYQIEKIVVIDITMLGMLRPYSAYVPASDPKGVLQGTGYLVNLTNNMYEWFLPVNITKSADKTWDEPPKFPGLTNAYFQSIELGKDSFLGPFSK